MGSSHRLDSTITGRAAFQSAVNLPSAVGDFNDNVPA